MGSDVSRHYMWDDSLDPEEYARATYYFESAADPGTASIGMAREQSAYSPSVPGGAGGDLGHWTARVRRVDVLGETSDAMLPGYVLANPVYRDNVFRKRGFWSAAAEIAIPIANFGCSMTNLWNAVGGELHRLGFLNAIRLIDLRLPDRMLDRLKGPLLGAGGIREKLGVFGRPLFCRSTHPAVGLCTEEMLAIAEQVLRGGFDVIKDDELTCDTPRSPFEERVRKMAAMVRRVEDDTGEKKWYIANVIDNPLKTLRLADVAAREGVDGLLVAPCSQGIAIAGEIASRTGLPVIAHNMWEDALTRHPRFGVSPSVYLKMQRLCGADMALAPPWITVHAPVPDGRAECISACAGPVGRIRPMLPVIAGGKRPSELPEYTGAIGSPDYMLLAATAVDEHPGGLEAGARAFREAWEAYSATRREKKSSLPPLPPAPSP